MPAQRELFLLSFIALFLEMMLIRWVPSVYRLVAYYANLMLISSFLGLGMGALASRKPLRLDRLFPIILFAMVVFLLASREVLLPGSRLELRLAQVGAQPLGYLALIAIFFFNVGLFMPLGQRVGAAFDRLPPLQAYRWDLAGSLAGTLTFGLFSFLHFSPMIGLVIVMSLFLSLLPARDRRLSLLFFLATLACLGKSAYDGVIWSPYYHITVTNEDDPQQRPVTVPLPDLQSLKNPPFYAVRVNQDFYQRDGTLNPLRYSPVPPLIRNYDAQYMLPYRLLKHPRRILIAGSGGGVDVEAALLSGGERIDAVEIDPMLVRLGRTFNASNAYADPRVHVFVDDARAFFQKTPRTYDLVTFGYLDSQALFSSMNNVRLDGFVYTVEGLRSAYRLLDENGVLTLSFMVSYQRWLVDKLFLMLKEATGQDPVVYFRGPIVIFCVGRKGLYAPPKIGPFQRVALPLPPFKIDLATDDWPYLYLAKKGLSLDYMIVMGTLLLLSACFLTIVHGSPWTRSSLHFFFLGFSFMLLETKSIIDCSLYLGATWLVVLLIVSGVLMMLLLANELPGRRSRFTPFLYVPLFISLLALQITPHLWILSWPLLGRILWTVLIVPLPILFAGLIFSTTLRETKLPSAALGANLIGATLGGFAEYLGMYLGYHDLSLLVLAAYFASLLTLLTGATASRRH